MKCNSQGSIVEGHFLIKFKVPLWLTVLLLFTAIPSHLEGSHLPPNYIGEQKGDYLYENGGDYNGRAIDSSSQELTSVSREETTTTFSDTDATDVNTEANVTDNEDSPESSSTSTTTSPPPTSPTSTSTSVTVSPVPAQSQSQESQERRGDLGALDNAVGTGVGKNGKRYADIQAACDEKQMTIFGQFVNRFKGRIYAYGYPDEVECGVSAGSSPNENITFVLPLGQCGVQMMAVDPEFEATKRHEVTLYLQYSSFLQQIIDEKVTISCVEIAKSPLDESMNVLDSNDPLSATARQGRRLGTLKDIHSSKVSQQAKISSKIGESWMEILSGKDPSPKSRKMLPVSVGQDVTLVISTKVMRGYDARIVNCSANDGSRLGIIDGYRSQQILDSAGCSVDTALVPNFRRRRLPIESRNRMITLHFATFPAFKFPERDHLHIKCAVAYCQGPCPQEPCDSGINHFGTWREKYGRIADALIDTTEIVNSIEVTAPELEDNSSGGGHHYERHQSNNPPLGGSATDVSSRQFSDSYGKPHPHSVSASASAHSASGSSSPSEDNEAPLLQPSFGSGSVCVSPGSIILALVILGVVLVISATATLWFALKRSEAKKYRQTVKHTPFQHGPQPYYRFSHW